MIIIDGYIIAIEKSDPDYDTLIETIANKPDDPSGYQYKLSASTREWELVELPPIPEPSDIDNDEIVSILLGGDE